MKSVNLSNTDKDVGMLNVSMIEFAFLKDGTIAWNMNTSGDRDWEYLRERFNVSDDDEEELIQGYIKPGRMVFHKSSKLDKVEEDLIPYVKMIGSTACKHFGTGRYYIFNGAKNNDWYDIQHTVVLALRFGRKYEDLQIVDLWNHSHFKEISYN